MRDRLEIRHAAQGTDVALRTQDDGPGTIEGYFMRWSARSADMGFIETFTRGAFAASIASEDRIQAFWNHDSNLVLGSTGSGTLELWEDEQGAGFRITLPPAGALRDIAAGPLARGDVPGVSFGFRVPAYQDDDEDPPEMWDLNASPPTRVVKRAQLLEVSPGVSFPAYADNEAGLRSLARAQEARKQAVGYRENLAKRRLQLRRALLG